MTWPEAKAALQLLAEESVGRHIREAQAIEDAEYERTKSALEQEARRGIR
jgi:hypothetical protein